MNIPDKIRKLLESEDVGDIIIGLQLFCKAVDNEEFNKFIDSLLTYENIFIGMNINYQGGYYFKYKNNYIYVSRANKNMFMVTPVSKTHIIYEYAGKS